MYCLLSQYVGAVYLCVCMCVLASVKKIHNGKNRSVLRFNLKVCQNCTCLLWSEQSVIKVPTHNCIKGKVFLVLT
jgi:hypothetical protein